jgi:glycosyltransferase involved in cell wall biosynthesis
LALDALKQVPANVTLTIAGDGMDPEAVHRMIRERNLKNRVIWKGRRLTQTELRTAYAEHDAMLFTSLRDSFGSQVLEAMAMGLPIITLDLHGAHDWVPNDGSIKVSVGGPEETVRGIANAIEMYALLPPARRNHMSKQVWSFAKTQSWSERAEYCERLYKEVLFSAGAVNRASASTVAAVGV